MSRSRVPSFAPSADVTETGPAGQRAHRDHLAHSERLRTELIDVAPGVWTLVGNGLSNQTFVEGPDGLIAIDTGECVEEMAAALLHLRDHTDAPVAAVIYTHFHYVAGTRAIDEDTVAPVAPVDVLPIWGHESIAANRSRAATEVAARYGRGLVHQFGLMLPADGADGLVNVGLGQAFRNPSHAPYTPGFIAPNQLISEPVTAEIAGLPVELVPAPSDADDSITIWFPGLDVCVNNLIWPALFNVFAIRGEEYRDPRVLLSGIEHILDLNPSFLVGTHGRPIVGRDEIEREATRYHDSIEFLWDQTVRGINRGLTIGELIADVRLPDVYDESSLTRELYGVAEHHVRQIHAGLVGWFDEDESQLFPVPTVDRAERLIDGFGGRAEVARRARQALDEDDVRWALELATWLVRSQLNERGRADGGTAEERGLLAAALRMVAERTTAANIRNWCLTRALELDGSISVERHREHRFAFGAVASGDAASFIHALRVLLVPDRAVGVDEVVVVRVEDGNSAALHVRHGVAVPVPVPDGPDDGEIGVALDQATLAAVLGLRSTLAEEVAAGTAVLRGDAQRLASVLGCFDHAGLRLDAGAGSAHGVE